MVAIEEQRAQANVHWLVLAPLGSKMGSAPFSVSRDDFAAVMGRAGLSAHVEVRDRLGAGDTRRVALSFPGLAAFSLKAIVESDDALQQLLALGDRLTKSGPKGVDPETAAAEVEAIVGPGRLRDAVAAIFGPPSAHDSALGDTSGTTEAASAKALLDSPEVAAATPRAAIDSFVRTIRRDDGATKPVPKAGRRARDVIEEAVFGTAHDVLATAEVAALEGAWRGLKLLSDECSAAGGMFIEVQDVAVNTIAATLRTRPPAVEFDQPDAIFVPVEIDRIDTLAEVAEIGETILAPIVAAVSPRLFGYDTHASAADQLESHGPGEGWTELRTGEATRWLAAVLNRAVLKTEGAGASRRSVLGSGVWAVAAMLARSYAHYGSFARVVGKPGALKCPGTWDLRGGRHDGIAIPTEAFFSIRAQTQLGEYGLIGLGSGRNDDKIILTEVPTVRGSQDAVPLPAQMLTGRIVRFAQWARDQVSANASADDVSQLFHEAAKVFLFPGLESHAHLEASVEEQEGKRSIVVHARVRGEHALVPLDITFGLPLTP
jgi:hypothetical protein